MAIPVLFTIAACVCLIILSAGTCHYIVQRAKNARKHGQVNADQLEQRLDILEKRLTDIQDIIISIDDQLKHLSIQFRSSVENP